MSGRVIKLARMAKNHRGDSDDRLIMKQISDHEHLMDRDRNPRKNLHLDTTKLSLHRDRVDALARGERVAPITIDMALTQKCSFSCISPNAEVLLVNGHRKKMKDVAIGDRVVSYDNGGISESTVIASMQTSPRKRIVSIKTKHGALECTSDHKIMTTRGWVAAGELRHDDRISSVVNNGMVGISSRLGAQEEAFRSQQEPRYLESGAQTPRYQNESAKKVRRSSESRPNDYGRKGNAQKKVHSPESHRTNDGPQDANAEIHAIRILSADEENKSNVQQGNSEESIKDHEREVRGHVLKAIFGEMGKREDEARKDVSQREEIVIGTDAQEQPDEAARNCREGYGYSHGQWHERHIERIHEEDLVGGEDNFGASKDGIEAWHQQERSNTAVSDSAVRIQIHGGLWALVGWNPKRDSEEPGLYLEDWEEQGGAPVAREILAHSAARTCGNGVDGLYGEGLERICSVDHKEHLSEKFSSNHGGSRFMVDWSEIQSIRDAGFSPVYDLECTPHHNFVADSMVVHNCTFCYAGLQQLEAEPVEWQVYERFLEDCAEVGVKAISLVSDGESTENPHYIDFILKAKSLGLDIAIGTNGLKLRELEKIVPALTYLRINFNAADPERNASIMGTSVANHEKVLANLRTAVWIKKRTGSKCTIGLQQVLLPSYADQVIPLAMLGREIGVDYLVVKHCSDDEDGRLGVNYPWYRTNIAEQLFRAAEALSTDTYSVQAKWSKFRTGKDRTYSKCFGTALHLQMSGTGIVAPCGSFFNAKYADKHIGDIRTTRFKDILASERYWEVINHLKSDYFDPRKDCASLCLQDTSNAALFNLIERGIPIPSAARNDHQNFL